MENTLLNIQQEIENEIQKALTEQNNDLQNQSFKFTDELHSSLIELLDDATAQSHEENVLKLSCSQGLGDRKNQQDSVANYKLDGTVHLDDSALTKLIKKTINVIAKNCDNKKEFNYSGSTLVACVVRRQLDKTTIISANVGDSRAIYLTATDDQIFNAQRLTCTHKANMEEEAIRVINNKGQIGSCKSSSGKEIPIVVINERSYIMLTRKIVCNYVPGITSEPSFTTISTSKPGFLILCSDGITDQFGESNIEYLFLHAKNNTNPAHHLRRLAYILQTEKNKNRTKPHVDNMSITVVAINTEKITEAEDIVCVIADGHGDKGHLVAEYITTQFLNVLKQQIAQIADSVSVIKNNSDENSSSTTETLQENNKKKTRFKRGYASMELFSHELTKSIEQQTDKDNKLNVEPEQKRRKTVTTESTADNESNNHNPFAI